MTKNQSGIPKLRFPGYTEAWEQRKLGEIFNYEQPTKYIVKSTEYDDNFNTPVLTAGKSFLLGYTDEISGIKNATVENPVIIFDDFTTGSHYVDFPFKIKSSAMKLLSLNDNSDNFYFMFNTLKNIKYVPKSHERHWISKFSSFEIYKPSQEEQQKIGTFFKQLDDTITLHQRRLDHLKEMKTGLLQKMFPKDGQDKPEIRFPGYTDAWEQRKLGDVFSERSERSGEGELISVTINSGVVKASELYRKDNSSDDKSNYKKVEVGDIAYNSMRMWQGASGYSPYNGILSPAYTVIIPKEGNDSKFLAYDFKRYDMIQTFKRNSQGLTSDTWNLKFPTLKSVKVMVPSLEEQQRISTFFESLDTIITLHQRKLDHLKLQKKALLQQMFV